jgi:hypothetical protein
MLVVLLALQIAAGSPTPASVVSARDSVSTVSRLRQEASEFVWVWRFYWEASEGARHGIEGGMFDPNPMVTAFGGSIRGATLDRMNRLHCHPDGREGFPVMTNVIPERRRSLRAMCPEWSETRTNVGGDERIAIDNGLIPSLKSGAQLARGELISHLATAARELPGDAWLAGQRVRFAVDQHDWAAAQRAVSECRASRWWCSALGGYVSYSSGHMAAADSVFQTSLNEMPAAERCTWSNLTSLLDIGAQRAYGAVPCAARDSVNARIWWLADPLYTEPGNERRAEHYSRVVLATIRGAVEPAERWDWRDGQGGHSVREMIVRYGWPSYSFWAGPGIDASHYGYLGINDEATRRLGVFTAVEYSQSRFHTIPEWSAVKDPWDAPASAWNLTGTPSASKGPNLGWWPQEHYARDAGALLPIDDEQTAFLRRHDGLELAVATDLSRTGLARTGVHAAQGSLVVTSSPDSVTLTTETVSLDGTAVWRTTVPSRPMIVGLEVQPSEPRSGAARTRYGAEPPLPLSVLAHGDISISVPILMQPTESGRLPNSDPATALGMMLGTTRLRNMQRVGVYWETYGIPNGDSVDVALAVQRRDSPNALRRLGRALHIVGPTSSTVTVRWREPRPGFVTTTLGGPEPIQARNVSIDLSRLVPDRYTLTVSVTRAGQTASAAREFEILPP